ncbi:serine hydrolase domain-containing protein [Marinilabilia rubra]|uniref:Serine hydrolase n=1 Tax=Marinilabilia rubra TaxID=2162893 RepID=A0A2U2BCW0_9BACT|nr:serine hydrolase domain-containing protein [Marinilabilia rubra]PWE00915.1 serine hydrolase [Marinilabilia rubra]
MKKKQKTLIIRLALLLGTVVSLFFVPWPLVKAWLRPLPDSVQEQVSEAINLGFDGIVAYVDEGGNEPAFYAAGYKNREHEIPADPHALFKIASVGKLYNALAVAKLVNSNKLSLDKTLGDYLPQLKGRIENADRITLRMMVQHRSGIPNYTDTKNYWVAPKETDDEKLALVLDLPANFEPGEAFEYSNTNYLLLVRIMNRVLGYDSFQYIEEEILEPLNLNHTYGSIHDVNMDEVMSGYYVGYNADLKTVDNGSMVATADDLGKFIRALNDGSVFKDQNEQDIYTSIYRYNHTGLIPGYQTIAAYHHDIDAVVILFTNTVDFEGYNWNLSEIVYNRILKILRE